MTRANLVIFLVTAFFLCVLLGLRASLRHITPAPTSSEPRTVTVVPIKPDNPRMPAPAVSAPAPVATAPRPITVVPVKPDSTQIPAPAVSVPLATEPRAITVVPVKPAPVTDPRQISTIRIAPDAKPAGPGTPGGRGPDGQ